MPVTTRSRVRVGGSGFTIFTFAGQPIAFAQQVSHTSPTPVGPGPVAIHPMDEPYPVQVITPAASGMGSLTLNLYELYNSKVWDRLGAQLGFTGGGALGGSSNEAFSGGFGNAILSGAVDLVDVFIRIAEASPGTTNVVKYIRPPKLQDVQQEPYAEQYHNCVITNILDGEAVEVGTMEVIKQITVAYTHMTRGDKRSRAWDYRDRALGSKDRGANA
jgi:hypothetical protein